MIVDAKVFGSFLKKTKVGVITDCVLNFAEDGIRSQNFAEPCYTKSFYPADLISQYQAVGNVGIKDIDFLIACVGRFGTGSFTLEIKDTTFTMSSAGKNITIARMDEKLARKGDEIQLNFEEGPYAILTNYLKEFISDSDVFTEPELYIETKKGKMFFIIKKPKIKESIRTEMPSKDITKDYEVRLSQEHFRRVIKVLSENKVMLQMKSNYPFGIRENSETGIKVMYVIAPILIQSEKEKVVEE